jgi:hypothetical protein
MRVRAIVMAMTTILFAHATACDKPACLAMQQAGLDITVLSGAAGGVCRADVTASDGAYRETLSCTVYVPPGDDCRCMGAWERPGTYKVIARLDGESQHGTATVREGECGVMPEQMIFPFADSPILHDAGPEGASPDGGFRCDMALCQSGEEWCRWHFEGEGGCEPLPEACRDPDADCDCFGFDDDAGGDFIHPCRVCDSSGGNFTVTCGGP